MMDEKNDDCLCLVPSDLIRITFEERPTQAGTFVVEHTHHCHITCVYTRSVERQYKLLLSH